MNKVFTVYIFSLLFFVNSCNSIDPKNTTSEPVKSNIADNTEDGTMIGTDLETDYADYETFKSLFPDLVLGGKHSTGKHLSYHPFIKEFINTLMTEDINAGAKSEVYAIGKITGYRGLDLYVLGLIDIRPYEDSYDNHVDESRILMLFKEGRPMLDEEGEKIVYTFNSHYQGEGGESKYECYFDKDTTIQAFDSRFESESATGYAEPIVSHKEYRWRINEFGNSELVEMMRHELSSDFYNQLFIDKNKELWKRSDWGRLYPTQNDKLWMSIGEFRPFEHIELMNIPMSAHFYYDDSDEDNIKVIFETSSDDNKIIDTYILGSKKKVSAQEINLLKQKKELKCPIVIKTSDGDVQLLPDGRFSLME